MYTFSYIQVIMCCSLLTFEASPHHSSLGNLLFFYSDDSINREYRKWLCFESQVINVLKCVSNDRTSSMQILHNVSVEVSAPAEEHRHTETWIRSHVAEQRSNLDSILFPVGSSEEHCPSLSLSFIYFFLFNFGTLYMFFALHFSN